MYILTHKKTAHVFYKLVVCAIIIGLFGFTLPKNRSYCYKDFRGTLQYVKHEIGEPLKIKSDDSLVIQKVATRLPKNQTRKFAVNNFYVANYVDSQNNLFLSLQITETFSNRFRRANLQNLLSPQTLCYWSPDSTPREVPFIIFNNRTLYGYQKSTLKYGHMAYFIYFIDDKRAVVFHFSNTMYNTMEDFIVGRNDFLNQYFRHVDSCSTSK